MSIFSNTWYRKCYMSVSILDLVSCHFLEYLLVIKMQHRFYRWFSKLFSSEVVLSTFLMIVRKITSVSRKNILWAGNLYYVYSINGLVDKHNKIYAKSYMSCEALSFLMTEKGFLS